MQQHKQIIELSDHVKNKIKSHHVTPISFSSDELILSDSIDDDNNDSLISISPQRLFRRRSSTFITYQIQQPSKSESFFTEKTIDFKQKQFCQECLRRENLLQNEHQRLLRIHNENRKLSEQLRSTILLNHKYQEENSRLKQHLTKIGIHLREYQMNYDLLKQQILSEQNNKLKQNIDDDQLKRLRHELHVYNQVIVDKQKKEQKQIDYHFQFRKK